ncbi:transcriptional adapter ADA2b [Rutidosis leptorrhynchoides]|uniref:transcriptional adapter ADA2b n=1 Tax=Rutidosis leptorrhynchoides TaxID=125765 RepID=UPI003A99B7D5
MGRSRGNFQSDGDPSQRSRRKKNSSNGDNFESASAGQGTGDGKKALYHCNYCNKDITGKIRIKCAMCPDFDLCIECFSVGAEVQPHKSCHPYRVMDNLSFPLICPDWNADEEILLLEGIEMYGLGSGAEVAEHVGTKNKEQCIEHYTSVYMNSPYFPLPDMSHVVGKNRKELLAMAKGLGDDKKGSSLLGEHNLQEESPFSPSRVKAEDMHKCGPSGRLLAGLNSDVESGKPALKKGMSQVKDRPPNNVKMEDPITDSSYGVKTHNSSGNEDSSLVTLSGYNAKRREFDPEYDNDAEQLLADLEFKDTDTEDEHELKLRVLRIFSNRLDERRRRKDFILERDLLYSNGFEKDLSPEEKALCRRYDAFMRFHSKEEHVDLLQTIISEHRTLRRIQELKEAQAAGCRTSAEAERFVHQKRKREAEENFQRAKQGGATNQEPTAGQASSSNVNDLDIMGLYETHLLSEAEKRMCSEIRLPPTIYLKMQEVMSVEIINGNVSKKSDAHHLFKIESTKIDKVYDMLVKKGLAQPS